MDNTPFFLTNKKWYRYEERQTASGIDFQRFELTKQATPAAIDSFKQTMITIAPDSALIPTDLNRFQQALGYAERQHLFTEEHGLSESEWQSEQQLITCAIRSYQLLSDNLVAPNTLIFKPRIAFLYNRFLREHATRINDENLNQFILKQDKKLS
ncbi:hypothetical protein GCM10025879_08220 [Leuconostoc litchii]|uniref:Substrate-binding protein n=1 Tax=Leuconostoc litchii TaxID=1981069 RepID=A0A6P2CNB9_9LACO|nr:substrate-binding protein [Leuconostoc litchii]TYC47545.1 substrate-binding protein [Leuconostoc litchii]GMA69576.1 hypothetical protein GCM10025879_08220 [Leuconostoc litchii]